MIGFVEKLKEVDTTGVEPLIHIRCSKYFRNDEVQKKHYKKMKLYKTHPKPTVIFLLY